MSGGLSRRTGLRCGRSSPAAARALLALLVALAISVPAVAAAASPGAGDLLAHRWQDRVLLVFVPTDAPPAALEPVREQLTRAAAAVAERDLVVLVVGAGGAYYEPATRAPSPGTAAAAAARADALRAHYAPSPGRQTFVLIGKDGTEKARQHDRLDLNALFRRIDSMPMRRAEMERNAERD